MILLDTQVLIWTVSSPERLSKAATRAVRAAAREGGIAVAAITLWEIAFLMRRGRLRPSGTVEAALGDMLSRSGTAVRPLTPAVAAIATQLPDAFPRDPADRLIAATAMAAARSEPAPTNSIVISTMSAMDAIVGPAIEPRRSMSGGPGHAPSGSISGRSTAAPPIRRTPRAASYRPRRSGSTSQSRATFRRCIRSVARAASACRSGCSRLAAARNAASMSAVVADVGTPSAP